LWWWKLGEELYHTTMGILSAILLLRLSFEAQFELSWLTATSTLFFVQQPSNSIPMPRQTRAAAKKQRTSASQLPTTQNDTTTNRRSRSQPIAEPQGTSVAESGPANESSLVRPSYLPFSWLSDSSFLAVWLLI
jgi:hypothetical protein